MKGLREIISISAFIPNKGPMLDLYDICLNEEVDRSEAIQVFKKKRSSSNFYITYSRLKNNALDGILLQKFGRLTTAQKERVKLLIGFTQAKILFHLNKKVAFLELADKIIKRAKGMGFLEMAISVSRTLELHYSETTPNAKKHQHYQNEGRKLRELLNMEIDLEQIYTSLILAYQKKKLKKCSFDSFDDYIADRPILNQPKFRYYYHTLINLKADFEKDEATFLSNTESALSFFERSNFTLPGVTKLNFLINLLPIYISRENYIRAEGTINGCLSLTVKGGFNWHLIMLYKALYGFQTNKPSIALQAWTEAQKYIGNLEKTQLINRWMMVEGYLALYHVLGRIQFNDKFRFGRFANTIKQGRKDYPQKANFMVLELMFYLATRNLKKFTKVSLTLDYEIPRYFNTRYFKRTKYFLRCLKSVVRGNFTVNGTKRHAVTDWNRLQSQSTEYDLNRLDREVVPYELLWEEVLILLSKG